MVKWFDKFWHRFLRRPYVLSAPVDRGKGEAVVLLHGIANNHRAWGYVLPHITPNCRVVVLDLLGFGDSPKPDDIEYTTADHARAVIATLRRKRIKSAVIVGHSMGALIAVEIAKQQPRLVSRLVLCGIPVYQFDVGRRLLPKQESMYARLYGQLITQEKLALKAAKSFRRIKPGLLGFDLDENNFYAFKKSLENTILQQTTYRDIEKIKLPISFLSGRLDVFVIRRHLRALSKMVEGSTFKVFGGPHEIGTSAGEYIAETINAIVEGRPVRTPLPVKRQKRTLFAAKKKPGISKTV